MFGRVLGRVFGGFGEVWEGWEGGGGHVVCVLVLVLWVLVGGGGSVRVVGVLGVERAGGGVRGGAMGRREGAGG